MGSDVVYVVVASEIVTGGPELEAVRPLAVVVEAEFDAPLPMPLPLVLVDVDEVERACTEAETTWSELRRPVRARRGNGRCMVDGKAQAGDKLEDGRQSRQEQEPV